MTGKKLTFLSLTLFLAFQVYAVENAIPEHIKQAENSVVSIKVQRLNKLLSIGTGFFIDETTIVTSFNIIAHTRKFQKYIIESPLGKISFKKVKHLSALHNLAVLEVETDFPVSPLKLDTASNTHTSYILGYPTNSRLNTITTLRLNRRNTHIEVNIHNLIVTNLNKLSNELGKKNIFGGRPILNSQGNVIGISFDNIIIDTLFGTSSEAIQELLQQPPLVYSSKNLIQQIKFHLSTVHTMAEQGKPEVQYQLGFLYLMKGGNRQDVRKARQWLSLAAVQELPEAQYQLGVLYYAERGGPQYDKQARYWFSLAAVQGYAPAQLQLGIYYERTGGPQGDTQARYWFSLAAEQELPSAQHELGISYYEGIGGPPDVRKARQWFSQAAEQGLPEAQFALGLLYQQGIGGPQDDKQARQLFSLAAEQELPSAQLTLGVLYLEGIGGPQDDKQARQLFSQAAEQGDAQAQYELGISYYEEIGGPQDDKQARQWISKAAERGVPEAQFALGTFYEKGIGGPQDDNKARQWISKAAEQGFNSNSKCQDTFDF